MKRNFKNDPEYQEAKKRLDERYKEQYPNGPTGRNYFLQIVITIIVSVLTTLAFT